MSLTTQLLRGAFAMSMLLMFALLALAATPGVPRMALQADAATARPLVCRVEVAHTRILLLAQTPADLETPARWRQACRA